MKSGWGIVSAQALLAILLFSVSVRGQEEDKAAHTWTVDQRFQGSSSSFGQIMKTNTNFAFEFNRHFGVDAGIPVYFVNYSQDAGNSVFKRGLGNIYADFRLNLGGAPLNYTSTLVVTAPTGDREKGLSTGRPTIDWNNGFRHVIAHRVAPYANIWVANTISDTPFFLRPFTSNGVVGHFEGGATLSLSPLVAAGASGYSIVPSGEQTIVSRIVETHTETQARTLPPNSRGRGIGLTRQTTVRVFETTREVVGTADLAGDHGFSSWIGIGPVKDFDLIVGYNRSARYSFDTLFWGIGIRLGPFGSKVR